MATYSYRNRNISIVPCSKKDIPSHIERVLSYWESTGTNLDYQRSLLEACVDAGTAIRGYDDKGRELGCLYWKPLTDNDYLIHFVWFRNGIILGAGLDYIYKYTRCNYVYYMPHQRDKISYASLLMRNNVLQFYGTDEAIKVNVRNHKIMKLYKKYFADNPNIKEV